MVYDPTTPNSAIEDNTVTIKYSAICDGVVAPIITLSALMLSALVSNAITLGAITVSNARVLIV